MLNKKCPLKAIGFSEFSLQIWYNKVNGLNKYWIFSCSFQVKLALRNLAPGNVEIYSESRISVIKVVNSRTSERVGLPNRSVRMDEIICCTQGKNIFVKNGVQILKGTIKFNPANSYSKKKAGRKKIERQKSQTMRQKKKELW